IGKGPCRDDRIDPPIDVEAGAQNVAGRIGGKPIELGQVHSDLLGFHAPRLSRFGIPFPNNWFESAGRIGQCQITGEQMWKLSSESWIIEERWSNPVAAPSRSRR